MAGPAILSFWLVFFWLHFNTGVGVGGGGGGYPQIKSQKGK